MYAQYTGAKQECLQWNSGDEVKAVDFRFPVEDARTGDVSRAPAIPPHFYLWYYLPSTYLLIATAIIQTESGSKNGNASPHTHTR